MATRPPPSPSATAAALKAKSLPIRYSVDVNGAKETVDTFGVRPGSGSRGEGAKFRIPKGAKLELFDIQARHAPQDVITKKMGQDLHIAFPGSKIETPDVIVQGYFDGDTKNRLVGKGPDGAYHPYTTPNDSAPTFGENTAITQVLGKAVVEPWGAITDPGSTSVAQVAPIVTPSSSAGNSSVTGDVTASGADKTAPGDSNGVDWKTVGMATGGVLLLGAVVGGGGGGGNSPAPSPPSGPGKVTKVETTSASEGAPITYTVTLENTSASPQTVQLTVGGPGTTLSAGEYGAPRFSNGVTYDPATGTVTIPPNTATFTVSIPTTDDTQVEAPEFLQIAVGGVAATATITDNEGSQVATVTGGGPVKEGGTVKFTVTLDKPTAAEEFHAVSINGTNVNGDDFSGYTFTNGVTYDAKTQSLKIPPGVTTFEATVQVKNDKVFEGNETATFVFDKTAAPPVTITDSVDGIKVETITAPPSVKEGESATFTVNLNASTPVGTPTTLDINLSGTGTTDVGPAPVTASNGVTIANGKVTIPGGVTSFTVTVPTNQDADVDPNENLLLSVGGKTSAATVIIDDDAPPVKVTGVVPDANSASIPEGGTATFVVSLSGATTQEQKFTLAMPSSPGTAEANDVSGFGSSTPGVTVVNGVVTVPPGVTTFTITVTTVQDPHFELPEPLTITVDGLPATTVIQNDDPLVTPTASETPPQTSADAHTITELSTLLDNPELIDTRSFVSNATATGTTTSPDIGPTDLPPWMLAEFQAGAPEDNTMGNTSTSRSSPESDGQILTSSHTETTPAVALSDTVYTDDLWSSVPASAAPLFAT